MTVVEFVAGCFWFMEWVGDVVSFIWTVLVLWSLVVTAWGVFLSILAKCKTTYFRKEVPL